MRNGWSFIRRAGLPVHCVITCVMGGVGTSAMADEAPTVTPYRPSVSSPAALSAPGWVEVEAGVQNSRGEDASRRVTLPYTFKLAFTPDWGVRIGGDALVRQTEGGGAAQRGGGDTTIVLKRRFELNDDSAWGLELGTKLPTARRGLGSGRADTGVNAIYSSDFAPGWHTDLNLAVTRIGGVPAGQSRWQQAWATSVSRNLSEQWGVGGELAGTRQGGNASTAQALFAASYAVSRKLSLDVGVSKGLNAASGAWSAFAGLTFLAARVF